MFATRNDSMANRLDPVKQAIAREVFASLLGRTVIMVPDVGVLNCFTEQTDFYTLVSSVRTSAGKRRTFEVIVKEKVW